MNQADLFRILKERKKHMTRQQLKTIRGQVLSGDFEGAVKGIERATGRMVRL